MAPKFYPSVMCMEYRSWLREEIASFEKIGVDGFHVDIIDGIFADGFISTGILRIVREYTTLPLGVHMMVKHPFDYLEQLYKSRPETIYVHFEAENPAACLVDIRAHNYNAGLAVCPETSIQELSDILPMVDRLLLLRVPIGTTGHSPVAHVDEKIERVVNVPNRHFGIACDGAISADFVRSWFPRGVSYFVCGKSSALFDRNCDRAHRLRELHVAAHACVTEENVKNNV